MRQAPSILIRQPARTLSTLAATTALKCLSPAMYKRLEKVAIDLQAKINQRRHGNSTYDALDKSHQAII